MASVRGVFLSIVRLLSFDDISFDDILLDYNISDDDIFVNDILKRVYHLKLMCGRMMLGSKAPNYDAYGLRRVASPLGFRAMHSHNPTQYSHIVGCTSHFYAHIGAGSKVFPHL